MSTLRFSLLLALAPASFANDVIVVAPTGGDFTDLQAAVDFAADGDTILVQGGSYALVRIEEGLTVVGEGTVTVSRGLTVANTGPDQPVILIGLRLVGEHLTQQPIVPALHVRNAFGPVRVEECELLGAEGPGDCGIFPARDCAGGPAARIDVGLDVAFRSCTLVGGEGARMTLGREHNAGGEGLLVHGGSVALHDCVANGGDGAQGIYDLEEGGHGGDGARAEPGVGTESTLVLSNCRATGGVGGDGWLCLCAGGDGGDGLELVGSGTRGFLLDSTLTGNIEGCSDGPTVPGVPLRLELGAEFARWAGRARTLTGPAPLREGESATLEVHGEPGDHVWLVRGVEAQFLLRPAFSGVALVRAPFAPADLGVIPAGGLLTWTFSAGDLPAGTESAIRLHQAYLVDTSGRIWISGAWTSVVLDAQF